ncbi:MAG: arginine--tRNA ligase [Gammaproteobacteria bacterium]|nr:arginine--tRNA ligase [Gammaproteobacteria bacterium]
MKAHLEALFTQAVQRLIQENILPADIQPRIQISNSKDPSHGDFATNLALMLAKPAGQSPKVLAEKLINALPESDRVLRVEIAGPGFINVFQQDDQLSRVLVDILNQGERFGHSQTGQGKRVQVEFVSANPTGPLHVGHGRGAAYGATLANLLDAAGYDVQREYYVNDAGRQMDILAASVWLRYLEQQGVEMDFPSNGYRGDYVYDMAVTLEQACDSQQLIHSADTVFSGIPADAPVGDKEAHIDALIARAKHLLGEDVYRGVHDHALSAVIKGIQSDLEAFRVHFDTWFSERSLMDTGAVAKAIQALTERGHTYTESGALWFKSSALGDEKDRVIVRDNGQTTYFASDIAYVLNKVDRGFEKIIYVWGADHHGYIPRMKAAAQALGVDPNRLNILLVQFANLFRGGEPVQMSTRSGQFVTLKALCDEVGEDAARFFYVMRRCEQHLDFDLDLAKSQTNENPVYYVQYAHARICSIWRQLDEKSYVYDEQTGMQHLEILASPQEKDLIKVLARFPEVVARAAENEEPHALTHYLREVSQAFHADYNAHQFIVEENTLRNARLCLAQATRQVLRNGLKLLDVSAPEKM